ncbi:MAG: sigma-70 family RNA polymerase sigma factor, partial [Caldicoprobacterales bacterium]
MGNALQAYTQQYEDQDQMLFQAIIKLKRGNKKAFEQVYNLSERYIYTIIYRIVRDNEKTADLMQDTYIQIYKKIHTLRNVEAFFVWAGRIATNNTLRFIQKDSREVLASEEDNDFVFEKASDDKEEFLPEDILLNKEKRQKIREIINNLSQVQKITVLNYYFGEMSVSEIAQAMQCSPGTVKSRLNYARKQIKQAVLDTEKREGVKLYSLSTLPLFTLLLREEMATIAVPDIVSSSVIKGIVETLGINIAGIAGIEVAEVSKKGIKGIKEMIRKFFETTGGKVASGVTVAAVAGTIAVTQIPAKPQAVPGNITEFTNGIYSDYDILFVHDIHLEDYGYGPLYWRRYDDDSESKYLIDGKYFVCQNDNGYKGVYTIDGEEILPLEFDEILYNEFTGGLFRVKKGDKFAFYDKSGKMVSDTMYGEYEIGYVRDGMFWCADRDRNNYKIYTVDGRQLSNSTFDSIIEMVNGLAVVEKDGKMGVLKEDGN